MTRDDLPVDGIQADRANANLGAAHAGRWFGQLLYPQQVRRAVPVIAKRTHRAEILAIEAIRAPVHRFGPPCRVALAQRGIQSSTTSVDLSHGDITRFAVGETENMRCHVSRPIS